MKNANKTFGTFSRMLCVIALTAVIGLSMTACGGGGGGGAGELTITGIPSTYNGKYIYAVASILVDNKNSDLYAAKDYIPGEKNYYAYGYVTAVKIEKGQATLNVLVGTWHEGDYNIDGYGGSDEVIFTVYICDKEEVSIYTYTKRGSLKVKFKDGVAAGEFKPTNYYY